MSLYALIDGTRARATPATAAACLDCHSEMTAKCGDVLVWHWAHTNRPDHCTSPYGESEWHLLWKERAIDGTQEYPHPTRPRRADVRAPSGFVVEFQRSPLTATQVRDRENDWDRRLVWVLDAEAAYNAERLRLFEPEPGLRRQRFYWFKSPEIVRAVTCTTLYDLGDDELFYVEYGNSRGNGLSGSGWWVSLDWVITDVLRGERWPNPPDAWRGL